MSARISTGDRVIVRAPSHLGDLVMAEPAMRGLIERHERAGNAAAIAISAPGRLLALLEGRFPGVQRLPISPREPEALQTWRERDVALLLDGSFESAWRALRAGIPVRAGFAGGGRAAALTHPFAPARESGGVPAGLGRHGRFPRRLPRPFAASCIEILAWLGVSVAERAPRLIPSAGARESAEARLIAAGLPRGEPYLLANAGARPGSAKAFPAACFAAALDALARRASLPVVIACAAGEEENARATARSTALARTFLLADPPVDLPELAALTASARLALGPDAGPRHLAEALGTPCIAVCGPTDPRHTAEHGPRTRVLAVTVPCGPCHLERCPLAGEANHACMKRVAPDAVAAAALELLG